MNIKQILAVLIVGSAITGCSSLMASSALLKVQKGMSQEDVAQLLGTPDYRRFDPSGEQWEYNKTNALTAESKTIVIDFSNGRVSHMDSFDTDAYSAPPVAICPPASPIITPVYPDHYRPQSHSRAMNDSDFREFYNRIKNKPFKDDQLELLETGAINNYFTSNQCIRLMSIYTFDDDKLKVLEIIANRIVDRENYANVVESFTFLSSKDKAQSFLKTRVVYGAMRDDDFQRFYNDIKREHFKDEQLKVIASGVKRNRFTCNQCIRLMSIFNFDDEKLKALEILTSHLLDKENSREIIKELSFISSQDKAKRLLGLR